MSNELKYRRKGLGRLSVTAFVIAVISYGAGLWVLMSDDIVLAVLLLLIGALANCIGWLMMFEVYGGTE